VSASQLSAANGALKVGEARLDGAEVGEVGEGISLIPSCSSLAMAAAGAGVEDSRLEIDFLGDHFLT
jgi:hypothetical protein